jgi:general secretion pathway protein G
MINRISRKTRAGRGFSFLEIMLVVLIIGIMLAVIGPNLVGKSKTARINATKQQMESLKTALGLYETSIGDFPTTDQGLKALVERPQGVPEEDWSLFMSDLPNDAWGTAFQYSYPGERGRFYDLVSAGPDRQFGTDDDITNFKKEGEAVE